MNIPDNYEDALAKVTTFETFIQGDPDVRTDGLSMIGPVEFPSVG